MDLLLQVRFVSVPRIKLGLQEELSSGVVGPRIPFDTSSTESRIMDPALNSVVRTGLIDYGSGKLS